MISKKGKKRQPPRMIGTGHDCRDDQKRITLGEGFVAIGGSKETHERMQEEGVRFSEEAAKKGKTLSQLSQRELNEVVEKVLIEKR